MKQKTTKALSILLSLLLTAAVLCTATLTVGAEAEANPYFETDDCSATAKDHVQYYVFHDGTIAFFGTGAIQSCTPNADKTPSAPWYNRTLIQSLTSTKISIEDGITEIGAYAFYIPKAYTGFGQIKNIDLPNSLIKIGDHAFENQDKLEKLSIPENVTYIGENAFNGCNRLKDIDIYANPYNIKEWKDSTRFTQQVTCHLKPEYANLIEGLTASFSKDKHIKFEANLHYDNSMVDDGTKRNIKGSNGQEHSEILGNALPFIVVGTFSGAKKSVTYGNNGFASCVKIGSDYYVHTNNSSQNLNLANRNDTTGRVESVGDAHPSLKLQTTYDYVGSNIVRLKYSLENTSKTEDISGVMLGGTGDIKIGADDYAAIEPMMKGDKQIGFYMTSTKAYDKSGDEYATLGFIGKDVELKKDANNQPVYSPDATFFYGATAANKAESATGAFRHILMPERIFVPNSGKSQQTGSTAKNTDSGMSYYWDVGTISKNETKEFAVMFSVYGATEETAGTGMIQELAQKYYTVTWANHDGSVVEKQLVKDGDTPVFTEDPPVREHDAKNDYEFTGWSPEIVACTEDKTYTAQYNEIPRQLFAGHSLTLGGDIGVKFYLDVPVADVAVADVKNGTKTIVVKFTWFNKQAEYQLNKEDKDDYSVRAYGKHIIDHPYDFSLPLVDLATKMLDYGAKAQVVFDRIKDSPANAGVSYVMEDHTITGDYPDMEQGLDGTGLEYYNTSLLFNSKTGLRQYYRVRNTALFNALPNRNEFKQNGNLYYLEIEEIPAYELAIKQTFNVGSLTFKYAALDYAMALQELDDNDQKNLGTAMYWYNQAAIAYFNSVNPDNSVTEANHGTE